MADKDKLYITITDKRPSGEKIPTNPNGQKSDDEDDGLFSRAVEHQMFHFVKSQTMQAVNFQINNIGNFTGDYITQRKVSRIKSGITAVVDIGMTTLAGSKYGPIGAAVGFVIGVMGATATAVYENETNLIENRRVNYSLEQLRERAGLNQLNDGSRGTEN